MLKKLIIFLVVLLLIGSNVLGQTIDSVRAAWVKRYNGPGNFSDYGYAIAVDNSGYIYVTGKSWGAGTNMDYATIKYKPDGDTAWVKDTTGREAISMRPPLLL
jgi:hypothetical protein